MTQTTGDLLDLPATALKEADRYEWTAAATHYQEILKRLGPSTSVLEAARLTDLLAECGFKAAFQALTRDEFLARMKRATSDFEDARVFYEKAGQEILAKRAQGREAFSIFWCLDKSPERKEAIERSVLLADQAFLLCRGRGDAKLEVETGKDLLLYMIESLVFESDLTSLEKKFHRMAELAGTIIEQFRALGQVGGLLESVHMTLMALSAGAGLWLDAARFQEFYAKTKLLGRLLEDAVAEQGRPHALAMAHEALGWKSHVFDGDSPKAFGLFQLARRAAEETGDSYLTGRILSTTVVIAAWLGLTEEFADNRREYLLEGLAVAPIAIQKLLVPAHDAWVGATYTSHAECFTHLANSVETEVWKKKEYLLKAIETARRGMPYMGFGQASEPRHALSKAMYFLAALETSPEAKAKLLNEALAIRQGELEDRKRFTPRSWDVGVAYNYLALLEAELSRVTVDAASELDLLRLAVSHMESCIELCSGWATTPTNSQALAQYTEWYGDILLQLHSKTKEPSAAKQGIRAYLQACQYFAAADQLGPLGPLRWKIARVHDTLGEYLEAANSFKKASGDYAGAAIRFPSLNSIFREFSAYMDAWAQIEGARVQHGAEQYSLAAEKYRAAASLLETTKGWSYLSTHYKACSLVEEAEEQSSQEKVEKSARLFHEASEEFAEAEALTENRLVNTSDPKEKQELASWLETAKARRKLSMARLTLEDAKARDRSGDPSSYSRYNSAAEGFGALASEAPSQQSRRELQTLALFSDAWARMKQAEANVSAGDYREAARCFARAGATATKTRFQLLAFASESVCRALESGARFQKTQDVELYSPIKKSLESAASYYVKGGFEKAAGWTKATKRLFDALFFVAKAEVEQDPGKKTQLYHLAENHLDLSAKLFSKAGYPKMAQETLEQLESISEEKELLLTPIQVLTHSPSSSGLALTPVSLIRDRAAEVERFEITNILGRLNLDPREVSVGSEITVELELTNVGKTPATLVKLENIASAGLRVVKEKLTGAEEHYVDLRGKKLDYLKTYAVKIPLKASEVGDFELRPVVLFIDSKGNPGRVGVETMHVKVRDAQETFAPALSPIMEYLARAFVDDYMTKRLAVEHAGWRTLMDIAGSLKIPKARVYGDARSGHTFGKPLEGLVRAGLVAYRIVPGARGRGGNILNVRVAYEKEPVKKLVDAMATKPLESEEARYYGK